MHCSVKQVSCALHYLLCIPSTAQAEFQSNPQLGKPAMLITAAVAIQHCLTSPQCIIERELRSCLLEVLNCEGETHGQHEEAQAIGEEVTLEPQQG